MKNSAAVQNSIMEIFPREVLTIILQLLWLPDNETFITDLLALNTKPHQIPAIVHELYRPAFKDFLIELTPISKEKLIKKLKLEKIKDLSKSLPKQYLPAIATLLGKNELNHNEFIDFLNNEKVDQALLITFFEEKKLLKDLLDNIATLFDKNKNDVPPDLLTDIFKILLQPDFQASYSSVIKTYLACKRIEFSDAILDNEKINHYKAVLNQKDFNNFNYIIKRLFVDKNEDKAKLRPVLKAAFLQLMRLEQVSKKFKVIINNFVEKSLQDSNFKCIINALIQDSAEERWKILPTDHFSKYSTNRQIRKEMFVIPLLNIESNYIRLQFLLTFLIIISPIIYVLANSSYELPMTEPHNFNEKIAYYLYEIIVGVIYNSAIKAGYSEIASGFMAYLGVALLPMLVYPIILLYSIKGLYEGALLIKDLTVLQNDLQKALNNRAVKSDLETTFNLISWFKNLPQEIRSQLKESEDYLNRLPNKESWKNALRLHNLTHFTNTISNQRQQITLSEGDDRDKDNEKKPLLDNDPLIYQ